MLFMPLVLCLYVGVSTGDASVVDTNVRSTMLILSFVFSIFTVMGIKGSFSTQLPNVWGNPYWSVLSCTVALIDARARVKDLWIITLPFIYSGCAIAGGFAGAAQFFATFTSFTNPFAIPLFFTTHWRKHGSNEQFVGSPGVINMLLVTLPHCRVYMQRHTRWKCKFMATYLHDICRRNRTIHDTTPIAKLYL